jgi:hypothetical protein
MIERCRECGNKEKNDPSPEHSSLDLQDMWIGCFLWQRDFAVWLNLKFWDGEITLHYLGGP